MARADEWRVDYARRDGTAVAYAVIGEGDRDVVSLSHWGSHVDAWDLPYSPLTEWVRCHLEIGRAITFDRRGAGASDPVEGLSHISLGEWMDDLRRVLDAARVREPFVLMGSGQGAQLAMLYAATHPVACKALVIVDGFARLASGPGYEFGISPSAAEQVIVRVGAGWGLGQSLHLLAPSHAHEPGLQKWMGQFERMAGSPATAQAMQSVMFATDVRDVLAKIHVPTLIIHNRNTRIVPIEHGRYLAERIPGAKLVELDFPDDWWWIDHPSEAFDHISEFVLGTPRTPRTDRVLATLVFTDIVESTTRAAQEGDASWRSLLDRHDSACEAQAARYGGRIVKSTGDGVLATFDGPTRAVRFAVDVGDAVGVLGLAIRAGVHTGEIELRGGDVGGLGVHIAARIAALAASGEILTSRTTKDLTAGSGFSFADRGMHALKGVPDDWQLFAVQHDVARPS